ncbi:poly-beta-hydroxybutyrate polymerase [Bordetella ansorpii]|uniref:Poly-beta-hydroxybutyrate polymerase n=1 Tax=Bordetella ansorpii TaxID=288768 RepID=A0A157SJM1_9BORD|nr:alpha/beta fold hydrolase [Bordetella ansorpii]SAI70494.1 poly-beta-hydroxybutyrate polymerase [Bordetella ansorpii]
MDRNPFEVEAPSMDAAVAGMPSCPPPHREPSWRDLDRVIQAALGHMSGGVSPISLYLDCMDWAMHLAISPGKQTTLLRAALRPDAVGADLRLGRSPYLKDPRFKHPGWTHWPYSAYMAAFQRMEACWAAATTEVSGVTPRHQSVVSFLGRQMLDTLSPSNVWFANPEVMEAVQQTHGQCLVRGMIRMQADARDLAAGRAPGTSESKATGLRVGLDLAITPGSVVYSNKIMELIRYTPQTPHVHPEPVLIVPSWLLKYYILDLSPRNSLVRYLVESGHTVYMISWKNPREESKDWGLDTYLEEGLRAALHHTSHEMDGNPVHAVGYCLGGTLLAVGAAALARKHARRPLLKSMTLLAAQTDFSEPGELGLFTSSSGVSFLDALMWQQGFLGGKQLAGVFQLLNSRDLIWSRMTHEYLLGRDLPMTDLMAWNADTTRLPYRLHSDVLHNMYLENNLAGGRLCVAGERVALADIQVPMMVVATEKDHISPWRSVHKIHLLTHGELGFVLCSGGHNVGIINPPGQPKRYFRWKTRSPGGAYVSPDEWVERAKLEEGSWWPHWQGWLARHSGAKAPAPPYPAAKTLGEAPGTYVLEH